MSQKFNDTNPIARVLSPISAACVAVCVCLCFATWSVVAQDPPDTVFKPPPRPVTTTAPTRIQTNQDEPAVDWKIGVVLPLSGKHKRIGEVVRDALTLARVDYTGPELVFEDSRGRESDAQSAVERLAKRSDIALILGPVGWKESTSAGVAAQKAQIPLLSLTAKHDFENLGDWVFRVRPSVQEQAKLIGAFALRDVRVPRYAILHPDDEMGHQAAQVFFETVRTGTARVTAWVSYKPGDTNLTKAVEELVGKRGRRLGSKRLSAPPKSRVGMMSSKSHVNFDALFIPDYGDTVAVAAKFLRFQDVTLAGVGDGASIQLLGISSMPAAQHAYAEGLTSGALFPDLFEPTAEHNAIPDFVLRYREAFSREATDLDAHAHDLYGLVSKALVRALQGREDDALQTIRDRMRASVLYYEEGDPFEGLTGPRWFSPAGVPGVQLQIWVVDSSGTVSVALRQ